MILGLGGTGRIRCHWVVSGCVSDGVKVSPKKANRTTLPLSLFWPPRLVLRPHRHLKKAPCGVWGDSGPNTHVHMALRT